MVLALANTVLIIDRVREGFSILSKLRLIREQKGFDMSILSIRRYKKDSILSIRTSKKDSITCRNMIRNLKVAILGQIWLKAEVHLAGYRIPGKPLAIGVLNRAVIGTPCPIDRVVSLRLAYLLGGDNRDRCAHWYVDRLHDKYLIGKWRYCQF